MGLAVHDELRCRGQRRGEGRLRGRFERQRPRVRDAVEQGRKREIVGRFRLAGVRVRDVQRAAIRTAFGDGDGQAGESDVGVFEKVG